ncbi:MAG: lipopolysaccharide assembly protein LapB [Chromatiales bacterium]|jgi:lipopolysaccharide biosynthesis regulator YciM|nr:lipopolysaccharide assembly protein LapB [Chromatiales bacterium]MDX9765714.1 lipopolysaccharide assembly protein LapB [Ectothiorhodospiraceae bacterium]
MMELLWLLLPAAAASGWYAARYTQRRQESPYKAVFSGSYIKGLNFLLNEQSDRAIEVFINMVEVDAETVETHLILGSLFRRRGEVDRAIRIHQNLIARPSLEPRERANAMLELGRDYLKAGVLDRAEGLFKEVIKTGLLSAEAYRHLRTLYELEKDWERAIWASDQYRHASREPQNRRIAQYCCELGEGALERQDVASASAYARQALAADPESVRANLLIGDLCRQQGDHVSALQHYEHAAEKNPQLACLALPRIRQTCEHLGDLERYETQLRRLSSCAPDVAMVTTEMLELLIRRGQPGEAIALLEPVLQQPNPPPRLLIEYARLSARNGDAGDAQNGVLRALDMYLSSKTAFRCSQCGFETKAHFWQCPGCQRWDTLAPIESSQGSHAPAMTKSQ